LEISGQDLSSSSDLDVVLKHGTTSFIVRVHTRTSGDSSVQLQLLSPMGHLQLSRADLTIRSTAISGVAIGLTVGAAGFFFFWWFRSASRRRRRHAKHASGQVQQSTSEAVQGQAS
jgi:heme/copper-type cytochrome/quinol oxidase subunit 2